MHGELDNAGKVTKKTHVRSVACISLVVHATNLVCSPALHPLSWRASQPRMRRANGEKCWPKFSPQ
jgi:hypothetical protein